VVFSSRVVKVLPFVSSQTRYGDLVADVIVPKAAGTGDVAVLKVGASSMPTVQLADSTQGAVAFSLLGFSGVPSDGRSLRKVDGHFVSSGAAAVKKDEHFTELTAAMTAGLSGGPVVAERGQVVGFLNQSAGDAQQSGPGALTLIGPGPIRAALTKAGINPHRGPADFAYESALHNYGNKLYAPAVPSLAQTMKLYPGHVLAGEALADATAKSGTAEDAARQLPSESAAHNGLTSRSRGLIAAGIAAAVLIGILAIVFLLRGRRGPREEAAPRDQSESPAAAPPDPRGTGPGPQTARREETVVTSRAPSGAGTQRGFVSNAALVPAARTPQSSGSSARPETSMVCGRCGEIVSRAHEFCEYCGQRLR
jgi:hypothetical protein